MAGENDFGGLSEEVKSQLRAFDTLCLLDPSKRIRVKGGVFPVLLKIERYHGFAPWKAIAPNEMRFVMSLERRGLLVIRDHNGTRTSGVMLAPCLWPRAERRLYAAVLASSGSMSFRDLKELAENLEMTEGVGAGQIVEGLVNKQVLTFDGITADGKAWRLLWFPLQPGIEEA